MTDYQTKLPSTPTLGQECIYKGIRVIYTAAGWKYVEPVEGTSLDTVEDVLTEISNHMVIRTGSYVTATGTIEAFSAAGSSLGLAQLNASNALPVKLKTHTSANTLGTVTGKVHAYDAEGNSLGYVAIYDAITTV